MCIVATWTASRLIMIVVPLGVVPLAIAVVIALRHLIIFGLTATRVCKKRRLLRVIVVARLHVGKKY